MLDEILAATRRRLPDVVARSDQIREAAAARATPPSFTGALAGPGLSVIAEIKRRSPSRGDLAPDLDPVAQARAYATGGAAAISVLTEPEYFSGSGHDLEAIAAAVKRPVLRKDFIVDPVQVWEGAAWGASAILLIVAALGDTELARLIQVADEAGLSALVEVHTDDEARRATAVGAAVVGVNNRDLADFSVDLGTAERIAKLLDGAAVTVAESGIFDRADAARMSAAGFDAVLVGEALVRAPDPVSLVAELRSGTR
jgi:indole-3-glycerol phosphate synthase